MRILLVSLVYKYLAMQIAIQAKSIFLHHFLDMMNWSINPGIQSQRIRLEDEITNSKSRIKLPIPKVPTGIIKATGKNRTTKNNPGLILHRIPNSVRNESFTLFKNQAKRYNFDWIEGIS